MLSVHYGLKANLPATRDEDALYFCTDTRELFKGSALYSEPARFVSTVPAAPAQGVLYILPSGEIQAFNGTTTVTVALPTTDYASDGVIGSSDTDSTLPTSKRVYETIRDITSDAASQTWVNQQLANYAPLASPALTGVPTAPTATAADSSTQIANTAFVAGEIASALASIAGALHFKGVVATVADLPASGNTEGDVYQVTTGPQGTDAEYVWTLNASQAGGEWTELGSVIDLSAYLTIANAQSTYAPLASPALTGTPTAPTATSGDSSTKIATTAFVADAIDDLDIEDYAPLDSPAFTGTPTAPTNASSSDNSTQIATTAFVQSVVSAHASDYDAAGSAAAAQSAAVSTSEAYTDTKLTWGTF